MEANSCVAFFASKIGELVSPLVIAAKKVALT